MFRKSFYTIERTLLIDSMEFPDRNVLRNHFGISDFVKCKFCILLPATNDFEILTKLTVAFY